MEELKQQLFSVRVELQCIEVSIQEIKLLLLEIKYKNTLREFKQPVKESIRR